MATLERRVQVLFDEESYAKLVAQARDERMSVGAFIRDAVDQRLASRRRDVQAALRRLWASADEHPQPVEEWNSIKNDLLERPFLRDIS